MKSFLWLAGVTLSVFAVVRFMEARKAGIPLDIAFKHPFTNTNELKSKIDAQNKALLQTINTNVVVS